jgi:hypothetical protein
LKEKGKKSMSSNALLADGSKSLTRVANHYCESVLIMALVISVIFKLLTLHFGFHRVKVYVNNATQGVQEQLVPGALICITHCESKDGIGFPSYVQTTVFSQVSFCMKMS